jgi:hypothetical protein
MQNDTVNMLPSQILFGLAILAFIALVVVEKLKPYRRFTDKIDKESFVTNTTTFLFNNIILAVLRATSLFFVAQQFSSHGLLSGIGDNPIKWVFAFLLYDLAIYAWHVGFTFLTCFLKSYLNACSLSLSGLMLTLCLRWKPSSCFLYFSTIPTLPSIMKSSCRNTSSLLTCTVPTIRPCVVNMTATMASSWHFGTSCLIPARNWFLKKSAWISSSQRTSCSSFSWRLSPSKILKNCSR